MTYVATAIISVLATCVVFVVVMAPRHWEWYQDLKDTKEQLRKALERAEHYKNLTTPNQWGPVEQHEARIHAKKVAKREQAMGGTPGPIEHRFDDILEGDPL